MEEKFVSLDTLKSLTEQGFCYYHFPTQSFAQKWLRETKNMHIAIIRNVCGYGYDICKADNGTFIAAVYSTVLTMVVSGILTKKH